MRNTGFALASLRLPGLLSGLTVGGLLAGGALTLGGPFAAGPALADPGDTLVVTGDDVNVRVGPSTAARVKMRVFQTQQVMELQRQGDWVRAEIAGSGGQDGWIHSSLLASPGSPAEGAPAPSGEGRVVAAPAAPAAIDEPLPTTAAPATTNAPPAAVAAVAPDAQPRIPDVATARPAAIEPAAAPSGDGDPADLARFRQSVDYLNSRAVTVAGVGLFTTVEAAGEGVVQVAATDAWSAIPPAGQQSYANTLLDRWAAARGHGGPISVQIVDPDGQVLLERTRP
ncbi:MAG TPA: SH3 domain-containing protein [Geminicoccaceae bacterium]|nr:SH3 domain-containing protein [Geminicoccaceae bacterium]